MFLVISCSDIFVGFVWWVPLFWFFIRVCRWAQNSWGVGGGFFIRVFSYAILIAPGVGKNFSTKQMLANIFRVSS